MKVTGETSIKYVKWFSRLYPPFWAQGIKVTHINQNFTRMDVSLKLRWYLRNPVGSAFGGSLFSMTDPFYMIMFLKHIADTHIVWDKAASIDFIAPARGTVNATFIISLQEIQKIIDKCKDGSPVLETFVVDLNDNNGKKVAQVKKVLYFRKKKES